MITQVKVSQKYVNVSVAIIDDNNSGNAVDPTSAEAWFYKISQTDGSLSLDTNIDGDGKVELLKQDSVVGFYGNSINIETLLEAEYVILYKVNIGIINTISVEYFSIDLSKKEIGDIDANVALIKEIESGRWHITSNQMIIYKEDNNTELFRFDLFDKSGNPSETEVYERKKV